MGYKEKLADYDWLENKLQNLCQRIFGQSMIIEFLTLKKPSCLVS